MFNFLNAGWAGVYFKENILLNNINFLIVVAFTFLVAYSLSGILWSVYFARFKLKPAVDKLPGPPTRFPYGNYLDFPGPNEEGIHWWLQLATKYKRIYKIWIGPFVAFVDLVHPDTIKELLKTTEPKFGKRHSAYRTVLPWLGRGLLLADGQQWARNRRLLTPAFHFDILKSYVNVYNDSANKLIEIFKKKSESNESVEIFTPVSLATLETVLKCAFSYNDDVQGQGRNNPYVLAVAELANAAVNRMVHPWFAYDWIYNLTPQGRKVKHLIKYVHQVADEVIEKRQKSLKPSSSPLRKKYLDFLDILLSARDTDGQGLSPLEIRQEVDTFLFAGHDTTATAISWTLYCLSQHPDIQEKARQEVQKVLSHTDSQDFDWNDLSKLPYLTQCIKEGMRMYAPVPFIGRETLKEITIDGVTFPPHTVFGIQLYIMHHNPHVWGPDHMTFKPDRFSPENMNKIGPHDFIPFSAGPRNCIGQNFALNEMRVIIGKILNRFQLKCDHSHSVVKMPEIILRPKEGIKIYFE